MIGCGGIGSAAAYWLAREVGGEVLGLEQFALGHDRGESQDHSRIIRLLYHAPAHTALTRHTYAAWGEVEAEPSVQLRLKTGGVDLELVGDGGPQFITVCAAGPRPIADHSPGLLREPILYAAAARLRTMGRDRARGG